MDSRPAKLQFKNEAVILHEDVYFKWYVHSQNSRK